MSHHASTQTDVEKLSTLGLARCMAHLALDLNSQKSLIQHLADWGITPNDLRAELHRRETLGAGLR